MMKKVERRRRLVLTDKGGCRGSWRQK